MNTERLLKLADHLLHGQLGHKVFDFGQYNDCTEARCGTAGCAIGECPIVWPNEWEFNDKGGANLVKSGYTNPIDSGAEWFDLSVKEYSLLFLPGIGKYRVSSNATRYEVAQNIIDFVNNYNNEKDKEG